MDKNIKSVIHNTVNLYLFQAVNYLIPILILPLLVKRVGVSSFGAFAFAYSIIQILTMLSDYSFILTSTRKVAIAHKNDDSKQLNTIISATYYTKLTICLLICVGVFFATYIPLLHTYRYMLFIGLGCVIGKAMLPDWFFLGVEKMRPITMINFISKVFLLAFLFFTVKTSHDINNIMLGYSLSYMMLGITTIAILFKSYNIKFSRFSFTLIKETMLDGGHIFSSSLLTSSYRVLPPIIIGCFSTTLEVGIYSIAAKIVYYAVLCIQPLTQAIYPFFSRTIHNDKKDGILKSLAIGKFMFILGGILALCLFFLPAGIINLFVSNHNTHAILLIIKILAAMPAIVGVANIFGVQIMINLQLKKEFLQSIAYGSLVAIGGQFILVPSLSSVGSAIAVLSGEACVLFFMIFFVRRYWVKEIISC